jgi:hypothetical protein
MCAITRTKIEKSSDARVAVGKLADEIRSAKITWVGNVDAGGTFQAIPEGQYQTGSALLINPTTNRANFIVYFLNVSDKTFRRFTSASATPVALAATVTNAAIFRAQNYSGNTLTNWQNNRVISVNLEFFQNGGGASPSTESFQLHTAVTKRSLD